MKPQIVSALGLSAAVAFGSAVAHAQDASGIATIVSMRQQSLVGTHGFLDRRAAFEKLMAQFPIPGGVTIRAIDTNGVPGKWVSPDNSNPATGETRRVILYLHGGGFYSGSSDSHRALAATLEGRAGRCTAGRLSAHARGTLSRANRRCSYEL
jgi:monoterpene epsilon-lactone hydrolase